MGLNKVQERFAKKRIIAGSAVASMGPALDHYDRHVGDYSCNVSETGHPPIGAADDG